MYAHIRGTVSEILPDRVVLDACGVGYELFARPKHANACVPEQSTNCMYIFTFRFHRM